VRTRERKETERGRGEVQEGKRASVCEGESDRETEVDKGSADEREKVWVCVCV